MDPRDGIAKFQFSRPKWPGRDFAGDERLTYTTLTVDVDEYARPLHERLEVEVKVDHDLIALVSAQSALRADYQEVEIHDLEFGLGLEEPRRDDTDQEESSEEQDVTWHKKRPEFASANVPSIPPGSVRVRSNVSLSNHEWDLVPGEIVRKYQPDHRLTSKQREEAGYYMPCCLCGRNIHFIERDGCERCAERGQSLSKAEAAARRAVRRASAPAALDVFETA